MAETRNADMSAITVSSKVLGEVLGLGDRRVRDLANEHILIRNSHGKYLLMESVKNYVLMLKASKAGSHIETNLDDVCDLKTEQANHEHVKRQISDIRLMLMQGKVHKSEDVERVITDMFERFKSKMEAMPAKLARRLQDKNRAEIREALEREIHGALMELSAYDPKDYYSDEYIDVNEDSVLEMEVDDES